MNIDFSLWCDFIHKDFLDNEFKNLLSSRIISGATSNPSIFAEAFKTSAYAKNIATLKAQKLPPKDIYESLAIADIQKASSMLYPLFKRDHTRGFISIEIDPRLADNAAKSIEEGKRLHSHFTTPNVMIKVPATNAGYEVMNALAKIGININATLVFSQAQAKSSLEALQNGYKQYTQSNAYVANSAPQGVISVFVSRFDRAIESILQNMQTRDVIDGKLGIFNAIVNYEIIESSYNPHIRTLFASTGVKSPTKDIDKSYYIRNLILPHSINTAPLDAINAYNNLINNDLNNIESIKIPSRFDIDTFFMSVSSAGIDMNALCAKLLDDGMRSFEENFEGLLSIL